VFLAWVIGTSLRITIGKFDPWNLADYFNCGGIFVHFLC